MKGEIKQILNQGYKAPDLRKAIKFPFNSLAVGRKAYAVRGKNQYIHYIGKDGRKMMKVIKHFPN